MMYHEKNKLAMPNIAEFEAVLNQSIPDIDSKQFTSLVADRVQLRTDAGPGLLDSL